MIIFYTYKLNQVLRIVNLNAFVRCTGRCTDYGAVNNGIFSTRNCPPLKKWENLQELVLLPESLISSLRNGNY